MMHDTSVAQRHNDREQRRARAIEDKALSTNTPKALNFNAVMGNAALQHIQKIALDGRSIFSVARDLPIQVSDVRDKVGRTLSSRVVLEDDVDLGHEQAVAAAPSTDMFFSIVKSSAGSWHTVPMPRAWKHKQKDIVISELRSMPGPGKSVSMNNGDSRGDVAVLSGLETCDWQVLRDRFCRHDSSKTFRYCIRDFDVPSELVQSMLDVVAGVIHGHFLYTDAYIFIYVR